MKRISLLAFFVGNLCDIAFTVLGAAILLFYSHARVRHPGMSAHDVTAAALALRSHGILRFVSYSIGTISSVIAGFVGGKLGKQDAVLNGVLSDTLCFCLGLMILATHSSRDPIALQFGLVVLGIAAAALGGTLARLSLRTTR